MNGSGLRLLTAFAALIFGITLSLPAIERAASAASSAYSFGKAVLAKLPGLLLTAASNCRARIPDGISLGRWYMASIAASTVGASVPLNSALVNVRGLPPVA